MGALCMHTNGSNGYERERELCDIIIAALHVINDKTDGFLDDVLPNTQLDVYPVASGCGMTGAPAALESVQQPALTIPLLRHAGDKPTLCAWLPLHRDREAVVKLTTS